MNPDANIHCAVVSSSHNSFPISSLQLQNTRSQTPALIPRLFACRTKFTNFPNLAPKKEEANWGWDHRHTQKSQQTGRPVHTQLAKHRRSEQRKPASSQRPNERISSDCTIRIHQVHVNDVVQSLQENHQNAPPDGNSCEDLRHPANMRIACPREPKEANRKKEGPKDHWDKSLLRNHFSMFLQLSSESSLGYPAEHYGQRRP